MLAIIALSIVLQLAAALQAIRLAKRTDWTAAWSILAAKGSIYSLKCCCWSSPALLAAARVVEAAEEEARESAP
ncbi:MAG: hypothetical protein H7Z12_07185 [Rhodospirillaceae bacterium]|nr:hypothetical protein [Rhodospirillales bacterium]